MRLSSEAQLLRSFQERQRRLWRTRWTTQVWLTACGKTASIASGKPVRPSVQTKSTSLTPRLRSSVMTLVQKRAPSLFSIQRPRQSRSPSSVNPDRDVDGLLAHDLLVADRDLHRVQVDGHVQLLERPALPGTDVVLDRTGHLRDQPVRDVDAVQLAQMPLDLPGRHPAGVEREDLLVEAVEGAGVLGHDPRLERGLTVTRQLDRDRPVDR